MDNATESTSAVVEYMERGFGIGFIGQSFESDFKIKSFHDLIDLCDPQLHAGFIKTCI